MIGNLGDINFGDVKTFESVLASAFEAQLQSSGILKDPHDPDLGPDGRLWDAMNGDCEGDWKPYTTEEDLARCRRIGQWLYDNPWGRAVYTNRVGYIVGWGHQYSVAESSDEDVPDETKARVTAWLETWLKATDWNTRQRDMALMVDRDGECFVRMFKAVDGLLQVRYVPASTVKKPTDHHEDQYSFGIETDPEDSETVLRYWVNGKPIDASEIQHRKGVVCLGHKRGIPLLWGLRHSFHRASKLLRNGATMIEIQTAFAVIRKVAKQMSGNLSAWAATAANNRTTTTIPGQGQGSSDSKLNQRVEPGTIATVGEGIEYEFPGISADPSKFSGAVRAETLAIGAALVMPEIMVAGDASNNNRASALVAGDPSDQQFTMLQWRQIAWDLEIINAAAAYAMESGILLATDLDLLKITAEPPPLTQRDKLRDAQTREIDLRTGVVSLQTATQESGRDYETEQRQNAAHAEKSGDVSLQDLAPYEEPELKAEQ